MPGPSTSNQTTRSHSGEREAAVRSRNWLIAFSNNATREPGVAKRGAAFATIFEKAVKVFTRRPADGFDAELGAGDRPTSISRIRP